MGENLARPICGCWPTSTVRKRDRLRGCTCSWRRRRRFALQRVENDPLPTLLFATEYVRVRVLA